MKTSLLVTPTKQTESVTWSKPLKSYFTAVYGSTADFQDSISILNDTRAKIIDTGSDVQDLKLYYKYYSQLELIDLRVPFSQLNKLKKISFTWTDAFSPEKSHTQLALPFEKASVLFNIGAILLNLAKKAYKKNDDESFKEAIAHYQAAAGIYQFLSENFLHAPLGDLALTTVNLLCKLLLAQAQECFLLKVITGDTEQTKNSLISKLCLGVANMYQVLSTSSTDEEKPAFDVTDTLEVEEEEDPEEEAAIISEAWLVTFKFKHLFYLALTFYFQALALELSKKHGDAIAYMRRASDEFSSIPKDLIDELIHTKGSYDMLDNLKMQKDLSDIKIVEMEKENDYIYHDVIPLKSLIPAVKAMIAVKEAPFTDNPEFAEINSYNYKSFFTNVIPVEIHELLSYYSEEKLQFLRNEIDQSEVSNEELLLALEYMGLPEKLNELKGILTGATPALSEEVKQLTHEIALAGKKDESNRQEIQILRGKIMPYLQKQGEEFVKLKSLFLEASSKDKQVNELVEDGLYKKIITGVDNPQFKAVLNPKPNKEISLLDVDDQANDKLLRRLQIIQKLLYDLGTIRNEKAKTVASLKKAIHEDDNILDILILNSKVKTSSEIKDVIFPNELKKFNKYLKELDELIQQQKDFVEKLQDQWGKVLTDPSLKEALELKGEEWRAVTERERELRDLHQKWKKYSVRVESGVAFYRQLLSYAQGIKVTPQTTLSESMGNLNIGTVPYNPGQLFNYNQNMGPSGQHTGQNCPQQYQSPQNHQYGHYAQSNHYQQQQQQQQVSQQNQQQQQFTQGYASNHQNFIQPQRQQSYQSSFEHNQFGTSSTHNTGPPSLPPKAPSSFTPSGQFYSGGQTSNPSTTSNPPLQQTGSNNNQEGLIYDQPSTYQPNMYNFFSSSN